MHADPAAHLGQYPPCPVNVQFSGLGPHCGVPGCALCCVYPSALSAFVVCIYLSGPPSSCGWIQMRLGPDRGCVLACMNAVLQLWTFGSGIVLDWIILFT
jgi:hypothetical protein